MEAFLRRTALAALMLASMATPGRAQLATDTFARYQITLQLPPTFRLRAIATPMPEMRTYGYVTAQHSDGSTSLIQVTIIDLADADAGQRPTVSQLDSTMTAGIQQHRTGWTQKESTVAVAGVQARRVEWTGTDAPPPDRPAGGAQAMRGILIVGITGNIAFALQTQATEANAADVTTAARALLTFAARPLR